MHEVPEPQRRQEAWRWHGAFLLSFLVIQTWFAFQRELVKSYSVFYLQIKHSQALSYKGRFMKVKIQLTLTLTYLIRYAEEISAILRRSTTHTFLKQNFFTFEALNSYT